LPGDGDSRRHQPPQRAAHLGGAWPQAAPGAALHDPKFTAKVQDVVGLYIDPPEHALVLSVDEKSQILALHRTRPGPPMKKGRCGTMTHDYKLHGTSTADV
jgi:hypothetical protein